MDEIFKEIIDFPGYFISNLGNVKNNKTGKMLKPGKGKVGYYIVVLRCDSKSTTKAVHRLVAEHFIDNPENKRCVDHIDGIRTNNIVANLRWATYSENHMNKIGYGKSNLKGVSYSKIGKKYIAQICKNKKRIYIGYFKTPEEAHEAYKKAAHEHFGEFARC